MLYRNSLPLDALIDQWTSQGVRGFLGQSLCLKWLNISCLTEQLQRHKTAFCVCLAPMREAFTCLCAGAHCLVIQPYFNGKSLAKLRNYHRRFYFIFHAACSLNFLPWKHIKATNLIPNKLLKAHFPKQICLGRIQASILTIHMEDITDWAPPCFPLMAFHSCTDVQLWW